MIREEGGWWILLYFKDQGSTSVLNAIKIHRTSSIESFEEDGEHSGLCFVIKMESGQMYLHRAPDPQSREKWLRALNLARTAGLQLVSLRKTILRNQNFCSDSHEWLSHNFILAFIRNVLQKKENSRESLNLASVVGNKEYR